MIFLAFPDERPRIPFAFVAQQKLAQQLPSSSHHNECHGSKPPRKRIAVHHFHLESDEKYILKIQLILSNIKITMKPTYKILSIMQTLSIYGFSKFSFYFDT
jgi:hypothetical protein